MNTDVKAGSVTPRAEAVDSPQTEVMDGGEGALAIIDHLMTRLQKMHLQMRDLEREFFTSQQSVAFEKQVHALATKREAIEKNFEAAKTGAVGQIVAGSIGLVGASISAVGAANKVNNPASAATTTIDLTSASASSKTLNLASASASTSAKTANLNTVSVTTKAATPAANSSKLEGIGNSMLGGKDAVAGIAGYSAATSKREAEQLQLDGDFETQAAESFQKSLAKTADHALEASRQLHETTRELVALNDRVFSAVKF
ncbi:Uncharacterized protein MCB1EB_0593 [Mycoavidus cysteinexigens]|uniref:Uncharacterized protein n=1 Tax=Mycoavidus cysteinexigens TaxID=1553431 RepID=A0A2Z6ETK3_9BURK|nr:hypothetical protein [Mycoavidus cysteinexigens]BBE08754.1 Uncharacterized protein MCB1EB_0593 [Mycoavidus cysteinexigens]GAM52531.1 secretion system effector SseD [bacterium endosymbiont of Mortierella elongata FMR23-6]GLR01576.1 hypothetical protein GCM10007934_13880 [Mycoavidus cysteinexigens]